MNTFPKKYDHQREDEIYQKWEKYGCFHPEKVREMRKQNSYKTGEEKFTLSLPPPNVTGVLHLGHALMLAIEDVMVRYHRMRGHDTLWIPGTDHAGIATQVVVERQLNNQKKSKDQLGRTGFLNEVWNRVEYSRTTIVSQTKRIGASLDRSREQFTLSENLSRAVRKAFKILYEKGRIYKDRYMVNRSPGAQTVISDLEVEYREEEGIMYFLRYFIEGKGDSITIATVRPETIFADVAVAVHPKDRRYKKWIGRNVLIPIVNRPIPIIADERVSMNFGTGALKITPTHSEVDFEIAKDHDLPMDRFAFDKNNIFTSLAGEDLAGKHIYEYYENFIQFLDEIGNLVEKRKHVSNIPYCSRTGERIQPLLSHQRFVDVKQTANRIKERIENNEVSIYPERFVKVFYDRLENIKPWCISRQLRWGHRIPVRYDNDGNLYVFDEDSVLFQEKGKKYILSLIIFNLIADSRLNNPFKLEELIEVLFSQSVVNDQYTIRKVYLDLYKEKYKTQSGKIQEIDDMWNIFSAFHDDDPEGTISLGNTLIDILEKSANIISVGDKYKFIFFDKTGKEIICSQDNDVLDTWFSSGLRPFSILGWPEDTDDLKKYYPNTVLETGYDIIFFRVIRMMLLGEELTEMMPFKNIYLHGLVRDKKGQKFSKSKGNTVDPLVMIDKYGADALRGALLLGNTPGNDQKFSEKKVEYVWRFINKMRNASRYVLMYDIKEDKSLNIDDLNYDMIKYNIGQKRGEMNEYDRWMIGRINDALIQIEKYYEKFMMGEALQVSIDLVRNDFCDWYIEIAKRERSPVTSLLMLYTLGTFYKILHPALPFVTERLRQYGGFGDILMISERPTPIDLGKKNYRINLLMDIISQWRFLKQQVTKKPHEAISVFVQANKDIQLLVEEHGDLVKKIVNIDEIKYFYEHEQTPDGYQTALVMDIVLGAKGIQLRDRREQLQQLEGQMHEEESFLQNLRQILSSPGFQKNAPEEVVKNKKAKLEEVKKKITKLQLEISKLKMKHK